MSAGVTTALQQPIHWAGATEAEHIRVSEGRHRLSSTTAYKHIMRGAKSTTVSLSGKDPLKNLGSNPSSAFERVPKRTHNEGARAGGCKRPRREMFDTESDSDEDMISDSGSDIELSPRPRRVPVAEMMSDSGSDIELSPRPRRVPVAEMVRVQEPPRIEEVVQELPQVDEVAQAEEMVRAEPPRVEKVVRAEPPRVEEVVQAEALRVFAPVVGAQAQPVTGDLVSLSALSALEQSFSDRQNAMVHSQNAMVQLFSHSQNILFQRIDQITNAVLAGRG